MTSSYLIPDLQADEGFRPNAYPDPLSGAEPWTIGYGATGPGIGEGTVWTQQEAEEDLQARVASIVAKLAEQPWWASLDDLRQDVCANMTYNMGVNGFLAFHHTIAAISAGNYESAAEQMLDSAWAHQVPHRAQRLALQMQTGDHA